MNREEEDILNAMETRFKTLMIGSLSRFEKSFGYLWRHGDEPTTNSESLFRDKWEDLRTDLLNHGNNQIRLAMEELYDYFRLLNKYRYSYKFTITDKQNRNQGDRR